MKHLLLTIIFLATQVSYAEDSIEGRESGGGNSVVCFKNKSTRDEVSEILKYNKKNPESPNEPLFSGAINDLSKIQLLDLFENNSLEPVDYSRFAGMSFEQIVEDRMNHLFIYSDFAKVLKNKIELIKKSLILSGAGVFTVNDSKLMVYLPQNCILLQTALQSQMYQTTFVSLYQTAWNLLSEVDKAALLIHEAVYSYDLNVRPNSLRDSRFIRLLTRKIINLESNTDGLQFVNLFENFNSTDAIDSSNGLVKVPYRKYSNYNLVDMRDYGLDLIIGLKADNKYSEGQDFYKRQQSPFLELDLPIVGRINDIKDISRWK